MTPDEKLKAVMDLYEQGNLTADDVRKVMEPSQVFFAELAREARKVNFGEMQRGWTANLLLRAQEAGLFTPEVT